MQMNSSGLPDSNIALKPLSPFSFEGFIGPWVMKRSSRSRSSIDVRQWEGVPPSDTALVSCTSHVTEALSMCLPWTCQRLRNMEISGWGLRSLQNACVQARSLGLAEV